MAELNPNNNLPEEPVKTSDLDIFKRANDPSKQKLVTPNVGQSSELQFKPMTKVLGTDFQLSKGEDRLIKQFEDKVAKLEYEKVKKADDDQAWYAEAGNSIANTFGQILFAIPKYAGYIGDLEATLTYLSGGEADWDNWLSNWAQDNQNDYAEYFKVHNAPEGEAGYLKQARQWLFGEFLPQLGDQLGMQTLTALTTGGVGNVLSASSKALGMATSVTPRTKWLAKGIGQAVVSRDMESKAEASQVYTEEYNKLINTTNPNTGELFTEDEAKTLANEAATFTYRTNWANLLLDIPEQFALIRGIKTSKAIDDIQVAKAAGINPMKAIKTKAGKTAGLMGLEAFEEADQFVISQEGIHMADVKAGIKKDNSFSERLGEYMNDGQLWESALMGGLSAGVMQRLAPKVRDYVSKKWSPEYMTERDERLNEIKTRWTETAEVLEQMKKAKDSGDNRAYDIAKSNLKAKLAVRASKAGNLDLLTSQLEGMKNMDSNQMQQFGLDEDFKAELPKHIADIKWIAKQYQNNVSRYHQATVEPILMRQVVIKNFSDRLSEIQPEISEIEKDIPRINELSATGRNILNSTAAIRGMEKTKTSFETKLKEDTTLTEPEKKILESTITELSKRIDSASELVKEQTKSESYNQTDKDILKSIPQPVKDELYNKYIEKTRIEESIKKYSDDINYFTSKAGQKTEADKWEKSRTEAVDLAKKQVKDRKVTETNEEIKTQEDKNKEVIKTADDTSKGKPEFVEADDTTAEFIGEEEVINEVPLSNETIKTSLNASGKITKTPTGNPITASNEDNTTELTQPKEDKKLKTPLSAAWLSARNTRATDSEKEGINAVRTEFFENPSIDLTKYEVRYEIDFGYLNNTPELKPVLDALNSGKELNDTLISNLPVKAVFYENNAPVNYAGFDMFTHLKTGDYTNHENPEYAKQVLNATRHKVVEAYRTGKTLTTKVIDKTTGYPPVSEDVVERQATINNIAEFAGVDSVNLKLVIAESERYYEKQGEQAQELDGYIAKTPGAVYALIYGANNQPYPMRLFTSKLSEDEANLTFTLLKELITGKKYTDNLSNVVKDTIKNSDNPIISGLADIMNLNEVKYIELLNSLVFISEPGSTVKNPLYINKGKVILGNKTYDNTSFTNKKDEIKAALQDFTRQISLKELNTDSYKKYIIDNKLVYTNAIINDNSVYISPLVQPLIVFDETSSELKSSNKVIEAKKADIERRRQEELGTRESRQLVTEDRVKFNIEIHTTGTRKIVTVTNTETKNSYKNVYSTELSNDKIYEVEGASGEYITEAKKVENRGGKLTDSINAKYDAELAALEPIIEKSVSEAEMMDILSKNVEEQATPLDSKEDLDSDLKEAIKAAQENKSKLKKFKIGTPVIEPSDLIDLEDELSWYKKNLPQVPIEVVKDLIKVETLGAEAYGMFHNAMVTVSEGAKKGTVYHEAFHAVFNLMLTQEEREAILSESGVTEEKLAEQFELMREGLNVYKDTKTGNFFNRLWNIIKSVFNRKLTTAKLFDRINSGYYANKSPLAPLDNTPLYSRKVNDFTSAEVKSTVDALSYILLENRKNADIRDISDLNPDNIRLFLLEMISDNIDDIEMVKRYQKVLNAITKNKYTELDRESNLYKAILDRLNELGIIEKDRAIKAKEEDEEESIEEFRTNNDNISYKPSYESDTIDNATAAIKLLIATTPSIKTGILQNGKFKVSKAGKLELDYNLDPFLGLPKLEDYTNLLNKVKSICADIVPVEKDGKIQDSFEIMINRMKEESMYYPSLGLLASRLLQQPEQIQTQFIFSMSTTKHDFYSTYISESGQGYDVKIGTANTQSIEKQLRDEWFEIFKATIAVEDQSGELIVPQEAIEELNTMYTSLRGNLFNPKKKDLSVEDINDIVDLFKATGIQMTYMGVKRAIDNAPGTTELSKARNLFTHQDIGVGYLYTKTLPGMKNKPLSDELEETNVFSMDKAIEYLATHQGWLNASYSKDTVLMAEGNQYYTYSQHSLVTKTLSAWKQNPELVLNHRNNYVYNTNSVWLDSFINPDGSVNIKALNNFQAKTYGHFKEEYGDSVTQSDLKLADEVMDRVNRILSGVWVNLAKADKSTDVHFKGPKILNTGFKLYKDGSSRIVQEETVLKVFLGYLTDELNRVRLVKEQIKSLPAEQQVQYLHYGNTPGDGKGNGLNIYLFNSLSFSQGNSYGLYYTDGTPVVIDVDSLMKLDKYAPLRNHILQSFTEQVKKEHKQWRELGLFEVNKDGEFINRAIGSSVWSKYTKTNDNEQAIAAAVGDYVFNGIIGSVEVTKLFTGDPAQYKAKGSIFEDFAKRVPVIIATGNESRILPDMNTTYKSAVINNIDKVSSSVYTDKDTIATFARLLKERDEIIDPDTENTNYLEQATKMLELYKQVNQTDAQSWITLEGYKNRMRMWGKWTKYHELTYKAIKKFEENPTLENQRKAMSLSLKHKIGLQPLKTVHKELLPHNGNLVMQYNKQSEAVLNPLFTIGTELDKLRKAMIEQGVEHVVVNDGKKVGAIGLNDVADRTTGKLYDNFTLNGVNLSYTGLSLQQDLPNKGWKDTLLGSQVKKNILTNLLLDQPYGDKTGLELVNELNTIETKISDLGLTEFLEEIGYNSEIGTSDNEKLNKLLLENITDRPTSYNAVEAIELGLPIEAMPNFKKKMQNTLLAALNKKTVKVKTFGGSFVQMSNFGFADLDNTTKQGIIWLKDPSELRPPDYYVGDNGKIISTPGQVFLPYTAIKHIKGWEDMSNSEIASRIDKKLLKGLSYRIPNQNMSSNDIIEIVGILPPSAGDTMIAYTEITTKTGSDFDIDKQYVSFPSFKYNEDTNKLEYVEYQEDTTDKAALDNRRLEIYSTILLDEKTLVAKMKPLDDDWLKKDINSLFPADSYSDLQWFTPTTQMIIKRQFQGGKFGVGQTANMLTDHPLAQIANLSLNGIYLGKGNKDNSGDTSFSGIKDEDGNLISDNIATFLNAYVDIAKDPFIERGNHNTLTANVTFMLLRAGVSRTWINRFIAQPVLKQLVRQSEIHEAMIAKDIFANNKKLKPIDLTFKWIDPFTDFSEEEFPENNLSLVKESTLEKAIKGELPTQDFKEFQAKVLNLFVYLQNHAKELNNQLLASKSDTIGATKTMIGARVLENKRNAVLDKNVIKNFDNKFEDTMLGAYYNNSVETALSMFTDIFLSETRTASATTDAVLNQLGKASLDNEEIGTLINDSIYAYTMNHPDSPFHYTKQDIENLLFGNKSIATRLMKFKYGKNKIERPLIDFLQAYKGKKGNPDFVGISRTRQTPVDVQNMIYQDWENMLTDNNPELKSFAEDLIKYAYISSGFKNNMFSFYEYIPSKWMKDNNLDQFINSRFREYNESATEINEFVNQFFRNEYHNDKIVSKVNLKRASAVSKEFIKSDVFSLKDKGYIIGSDVDGNPEFKRWLKTADKFDYMTGQTYKGRLYKLVGYNQDKEGREAIYITAPKLGYNKSGKAIKEYIYGEAKPLSALEANIPKIDQSTKTAINNYIKTLIPVGEIDFSKKEVKIIDTPDLDNQEDTDDGLIEACKI